MGNYPPGVTGNEWEIAGYPPCGHTGCGHNDDDHADEDAGAGCLVDGCVCSEYTPYPDGPDPDELYDAWRDRQREESHP